MKMVSMALVCGLVWLSGANQAKAGTVDTIQVAFTTIDAGGQERYTLNGQSISGPNGILTINTRLPNGGLASRLGATAWVYCCELTQYTSTSWNTYSLMTLADGIGSTKAQLMEQLWARHYDSSWGANTPIWNNGWLPGQPANTEENTEAAAMKRPSGSRMVV